MRDEALTLDQVTEVFPDLRGAGFGDRGLTGGLDRRDTDGVGLGANRFRSSDGSHNRPFSHAHAGTPNGPSPARLSTAERAVTTVCPPQEAGWFHAEPRPRGPEGDAWFTRCATGRRDAW